MADEHLPDRLRSTRSSGDSDTRKDEKGCKWVCLLRLNLKLQYCHGQSYDGPSNMRGSRNGIAKILGDEEPCVVYTHCYGHSLILGVGDSIKRSKICSIRNIHTHPTFEYATLSAGGIIDSNLIS